MYGNFMYYGGRSMTAEKYVNGIVRKIKCSKKKRIEIKQQLLSEFGEENNAENYIWRSGTWGLSSPYVF